MKKVPKPKYHDGPYKMPKRVNVGTGKIEGGRLIKNFYRRIIKEHYYLGWRCGNPFVAKHLNMLRIRPADVNDKDFKVFILGQELLLLKLTQCATEEEVENIVKMMESSDEDNMVVAEMAIMNLSKERYLKLGRANPNSQRSMENYAYAKTMYYKEEMPTTKGLKGLNFIPYSSPINL